MKESERYIDPQLVAQIEAAERSKDTVSAAIVLREQTAGMLSGEATDALVTSILGRVARRTGQKPRDVQISGNLPSFVIDAPSRFLRALLKAPEIDSAVAGRPDEDIVIRPVESHEVSRSEVEGTVRSPRRPKRQR